MDDRAIRGIPWTVLSYIANRAVSVVTTIVLARLLVPADFGLFALATLGTGFISIFSGLGLGQALVLRQDMNARGQGTVLTLLLLSGVVFAGILAGLSPVFAAAFDTPRLTGVLLAIAGILMVSGLNWFYDSLLMKELEFRRRFIAQIWRTVVFSAVALALATTGSGVWALVGAHIAGHVANTIAQLVLAPYRVRPAWDRAQVRDIFSAGSGFVWQGVSQFLAQNIDNIIIGRVLSTRALGFYSMAYRQAELPYYAVADPIASVTLPSFARMRHEGEDVMQSFFGSLRLVALAVIPLGVGLSAAASPFTHALFGPKWPPMIGPLAVLGLWAIVRPLEVTVATLLNASGHAGFVGRMSMWLIIPQGIGIYLAAHFSGVTAVAYVMLGHILVALALVMYMVQRVLGESVLRQLLSLRPLVLAGAVAWVLTRVVADALAHSDPTVALIAAAATTVVAYFAALWLLAPNLLRNGVGQVRRALARRAAPAA
jgi:O-antigen/teichoic acid export membrane protein